LSNYTTIKLKNKEFNVQQNVFWDKKFSSWEPHTKKFYENYCEDDSIVVDIGAWIGPSAVYAFEEGAKFVRMVEPNPLAIEQLKKTMKIDKNFTNSDLIKAAVLDRRDEIGFNLQKKNVPSSAASIRGNDVTVRSILLQDVFDDIDFEEVSMIKIDIEGAEEYIIQELKDYDVPIWLSLHPPFMEDRSKFLEGLKTLEQYFEFLDSNLNDILFETISERVLSNKENNVEWSTVDHKKNFFEIALIPKEQ